MEREACSSRALRSTLSSIDCSADSAQSFEVIDFSPLFQRCAASKTGELRGDCPRWILDVLDAISLSRRISRTELVNQILAAEAKRLVMELNVLARVARGNPELADMAPDLSELGG